MANMHAKFMDDLTLASSFNYKKMLIENPVQDQVRPVNFHDRTNHILPDAQNPIINAWSTLNRYVTEHDMKLNFDKTKVMLFNPGRKYDFTPLISTSDGKYLEVVEKYKLLGIVIRSDLRWCDNTDNLFKRAMNKMWMLRNLKRMGASKHELLDIYIKHCRSILELAVPVWNSMLTKKEVKQLERAQKIGLAIIEGDSYSNYQNSLISFDILSLEKKKTINHSQVQ